MVVAKPMIIGQLARRTGVPIKTLREYEQLGLIYTLGRSESNYRLFDEEALWCVQVIRTMRSLGLTLNPTPHRFELNERVLFTWCALDSLMFPGLIGQTAQVQSPCASTGTPIGVTVTRQGVAGRTTRGRGLRGHSRRIG
jgi:Alkylmercury lyase/MerR family regulatory protein